jgi:hypothetical protein
MEMVGESGISDDHSPSEWHHLVLNQGRNLRARANEKNQTRKRKTGKEQKRDGKKGKETSPNDGIYLRERCG